MKKRAILLAASMLLVGAGLLTPCSAKDVTTEGQVTAVAEDGKSVTLKTGGGAELTVGVSSKRTKVTKGGARGGKSDLTAGKKVKVVYDDENPANEARSIDIAE